MVAVTEMSMVIIGPVSMETAPLEEFLLLPLFAAQLMTNWVIPVELIEIIREEYSTNHIAGKFTYTGINSR